MSATPNLTKTLVELLKAAGVKATKRGKRAIVVNDRTIATVYDAANGSIRLFVTDKRGKLPAKLATPFKLNQSRGYAKRFTIEDDLTPAVEAIAYVAAIEPAEKPKPSTRKTSTAKPKSNGEPKPDQPVEPSGDDAKPSKAASKTASKRKSTTRKPSTRVRS